MQHSVHTPIRPEKELVIALSRIPVNIAVLDRLHGVLAHGIDWRAVIDLAARWQVEPAVFGNLRTLLEAAVPSVVLIEMRELERISRAFAVSRTLQVVDLVNWLTGAGIPTIVLKGPAIGIEAYGDCSRRTFGDIDLLVPKSDLTAAHELLLARGFTPGFDPDMVGALVSGQHALEFAGRGLPVEVHWSLLSRHLRFDLGPDELWRDARALQCAGSEITGLAPHHLFLYLCAHGAKHGWMIFRWICDVAQLAQRLTAPEAERVVDLARRTNSRRIVALALRLVRETFGEEQSPFLPEAFGADRDTDALIAVAKARFDGASGQTPSLLPTRLAEIHPYVDPLTFWIRSRERRRDQLVCVARFIFEPAPRDSRGGALNALIRPARLAANAVMRAVHAP